VHIPDSKVAIHDAKRVGLKAVQWLDDRTGLLWILRHSMFHRVPRNAKWWYVFGSATLMFFMIQIASGIVLATLYAPSAAQAYDSLVYIDTTVPFGWFLRAIHGWSSNAMCFMMLIHLSQVFLHGSYKYPRELTWVAGVLLCVTTLGLAFTGQIMRWDADAYWGLGIGASIADRAPVIGNQVRALVLGGPDISGATLTRFFALHVFVLPGSAIALLGFHLYSVLRHGISEMPKVGAVVEPATYRDGYEARTKKTGVPFYPDAARRDMVVCGALLIALVGVAAWCGPFGPGELPDPTNINASPRPDGLFLWIFAALALLPPSVETPLLLIGPPLGIAFLAAFPFFCNRGERAPTRRPLSVIALIIIVVGAGVLTVLGMKSPWSPDMNAWTSAPSPVEFTEHRTPLELQGALEFQFAQCRNCHAIGGAGGERGPDLTEVATRLSWDQLVRQVQQGGGNMPAYGKTLSSAETQALVAYLTTLDGGDLRATIPGALEQQSSRDAMPAATK
jgi:ubiquinol-cytochrome c reductase cytochrome b subunit